MLMPPRRRSLFIFDHITHAVTPSAFTPVNATMLMPLLAVPGFFTLCCHTLR